MRFMCRQRRDESLCWETLFSLCYRTPAGDIKCCSVYRNLHTSFRKFDFIVQLSIKMNGGVDSDVCDLKMIQSRSQDILYTNGKLNTHHIAGYTWHWTHKCENLCHSSWIQVAYRSQFLNILYGRISHPAPIYHSEIEMTVTCPVMNHWLYAVFIHMWNRNLLSSDLFILLHVLRLHRRWSVSRRHLIGLWTFNVDTFILLLTIGLDTLLCFLHLLSVVYLALVYHWLPKMRMFMNQPTVDRITRVTSFFNIIWVVLTYKNMTTKKIIICKCHFIYNLILSIML